MLNVSVKKVGDTQEEVDVDLLPLLPSPRYRTQKKESSMGVALVLTIIVLLVSITHIFSQKSGVRFWWIPVILIYFEAIIAIVCLCGILYTDPGTIQRSPDTCHPIPETVRELLKDPTWDPKSLRSNIVSDVDGRAYCVRCFVWRPTRLPLSPTDNAPIENDVSKQNKKIKNCTSPCAQFSGVSTVHHCSICQRCVVDFDHHCSVFGRCIAARNMPYFYGIIGTGIASTLICILSTLVVCTLRWGWSASLIVVGTIAVIICCLPMLRSGFTNSFYFCFSFARQLFSF